MKDKNAFQLSILFAVFLKITESYSVQKYSLLMPNVRPNEPELYLCTPVKVDPSKNYYVVGFEPNSTMNLAHHILIYGCRKPGSAKSVWNCGEMASSVQNDRNTIASPCKGGLSSILYAWARDAPELSLPDGVGFKIGRDSQIKYLVLQVHYAHVEPFMNGRTDDSGVILHYTKEPLTKLAGDYLLGTSGRIPPRSTEYLETACQIRDNITMHPFAYRVHTHSLGKVVSGYVVKEGDNWIKLGERNPLTPQMFYDIHNKVPITTGDLLAARCTMQSNRDIWTYIGPTNNNEMCNFYIMYYVDSGLPTDNSYCFTRGPPDYYWEDAGLKNIPAREAPTLDFMEQQPVQFFPA